MTLITDQTYLQTEQYSTSANLAARMELHRRFSINHYGFSRWVFEQISFAPQTRLLEVGCGPGTLWRENADRLPTGLQPCLGDFSFGMTHEARQGIHQNDGFAFANLDVQALPFPSNYFDVVIANHMLYHVPDLPRGVRELARVLKPGGRLYAATNGSNHLREMHALIHEFEPRCIPRGETAISFRLENAVAVLGQEFATIEIHRYPDGLWVTEVEPLMNYIFSLWDYLEIIKPERAEALAAFLQEKIKAAGGISITKDAGLAIGFPS
jgi:ubiquinone/menaquinone biosynthesis C-methylase UbiE